MIKLLLTWLLIVDMVVIKLLMTGLLTIIL